MTAKNEHTGDLIKSKTNTKEYEENYDKIFRKEPQDKDKEVDARCSDC